MTAFTWSRRHIPFENVPEMRIFWINLTSVPDEKRLVKEGRKVKVSALATRAQDFGGSALDAQGSLSLTACL